jgi:hypothetical protein
MPSLPARYASPGWDKTIAAKKLSLIIMWPRRHGHDPGQATRDFAMHANTHRHTQPTQVFLLTFGPEIRSRWWLLSGFRFGDVI